MKRTKKFLNKLNVVFILLTFVTVLDSSHYIMSVIVYYEAYLIYAVLW